MTKSRATVFATVLLLGGCATKGPVEYSIDVPQGVRDGRAHFDDLFCAVLKDHGPSLPDHRPCEDALSHTAPPPPMPGAPVDLSLSRRHLVVGIVPGIGYDCIEKWLEPTGAGAAHLRTQGFDMRLLKVDALSGSATNARLIRDAIMAMSEEAGPPRLVLMGYSKGAPDILEALVNYPEIRPRIAAVVSAAGAVGGSLLAEGATESQADMVRHFPGATCGAGDQDAVQSLRIGVRRQWLREHPLPSGIRYYSLVTLPDRERISRILSPSYDKLAKVDARNDSQVIYSDEFIPGSTLLGFVNADHWAIALPINRSHPWVGSMFVSHNDYPREALLEAVLRYVEEDLGPQG
ncbi:MAG TPA: hypothetical protein VNH21_00830 [Steroidobacteraceae bacterium]|nr:hypothetical protein [Steroidobacteraceae bacterium]